MRFRWLLACMVACLMPSSASAQPALKVYLDCDFCFGNYIREEVDMVEYVRDPAEADIHAIVTSAATGSGGRERAVALIGLGRFKGMDFKVRALSESSDTEDTQRQRLATAITIGLLNYLSSEGVKGGLSVIRDQLSIPRRGVTPEEVLLRLRQLQSGYDYNLELGLTYTFGSIFNTTRESEVWTMRVGPMVQVQDICRAIVTPDHRRNLRQRDY